MMVKCVAHDAPLTADFCIYEPVVNCRDATTTASAACIFRGGGEHRFKWKHLDFLTASPAGEGYRQRKGG